LTYVICTTEGLHARDGEAWVDRKLIDWNKLRGKPVRIIYERERDLRPLLRAACAHDCRIDLLDVGCIDYAIVSYDASDHRAFKLKHGIEICTPSLHHMPPHYALLLLKEYQREGSELRRLGQVGAAATGRQQDFQAERTNSANRRADETRRGRRDAAVGNSPR
jgi:hypothetical protein